MVIRDWDSICLVAPEGFGLNIQQVKCMKKHKDDDFFIDDDKEEVTNMDSGITSSKEEDLHIKVNNTRECVNWKLVIEEWDAVEEPESNDNEDKSGKNYEGESGNNYKGGSSEEDLPLEDLPLEDLTLLEQNVVETHLSVEVIEKS